MSKNLFIVGTGTDVGKTYVSALIAKKFIENLLSHGYFKPVASGNIRFADGTLSVADVEFVRKFVSENAANKFNNKSARFINAYAYENAYSPHLSAQIEGNAPTLKAIKDKFDELSKNCEFISVEGAGGVICPLRYDSQKIMLTDVIKFLNLSVIVVANSGLGAINSTVLTIRYLKDQNINVKGIILNNYEPENLIHQNNAAMIEHLSGVKVLECVTHGAIKLNLSIENLINLYE
ncbi:dethiobiotin synthase [Campylobacter sp. faydin G-24]|uniref:ATP-dependent dethiobiotin synthetase BioD n=1 Tax=Campylobacter anatolicus TaxID=2829105 RepID=A0ABS5HIU0_9BACT|nr:dethiobiotin synthase [Campylobacter anatolicus]MBR8463527.1 dethiobiotin synthase [Campylobacter anatolicus]